MTTQDQDMKVLRHAADRLCIGFMLVHLKTPREVVHALLGFTGGSVPSTAADMKARLLTSYASLICVNIEDAFTPAEELALFEILQKYGETKSFDL